MKLSLNKFFNEFIEYFKTVEIYVDEWLKSESSHFDEILKQNNFQISNKIPDKKAFAKGFKFTLNELKSSSNNIF